MIFMTNKSEYLDLCSITESTIVDLARIMSKNNANDHHATSFSTSEVQKRIDSEIRVDALGIVYSIEGYSDLAVKEIRINSMDEQLAVDLEFRLRTFSHLSHPNILKYYQVLRNHHFIYTIIDRHHESLEQFLVRHMRADTQIPRHTILSIMNQALVGLVYLHSVCWKDVNGSLHQGITYQNLKLANILIRRDGTNVVLTDFGIPKNVLTSNVTKAVDFLYMAPETCMSGDTSLASDIWSLGVIIYELSTFNKPVFTKSEEPRDVFVAGWRPDLSAVMDDFIRDLLEKIFVIRPEERPTVNELITLIKSSGNCTKVPSSLVTELENKCSLLETALQDAYKKIDILEKELKVKSDKVSNVEENLRSRSDEVDKLKQERVLEAATISSFEKELQSKSHKLDALEARCKSLEQQLLNGVGDTATHSVQSHEPKRTVIDTNAHEARSTEAQDSMDIMDDVRNCQEDTKSKPSLFSFRSKSSFSGITAMSDQIRNPLQKGHPSTSLSINLPKNNPTSCNSNSPLISIQIGVKSGPGSDSINHKPNTSQLTLSQTDLSDAAVVKQANGVLQASTDHAINILSTNLAENTISQPGPRPSLTGQRPKSLPYNARKRHEEKMKSMAHKKLTDPGKRVVPQSKFITHMLSLLENRKELSYFYCKATGTEFSYKDVLIRMDSEITSPSVNNTRKQLSVAISRYFDISKTLNIDEYLVD